MKYIMFEDFSGRPIPVIFPKRIGHEEMREQLPYATVLSAGFVDRRQTGFVCHGSAPELHAKADKGDAEIIARHFEPAVEE